MLTELAAFLLLLFQFRHCVDAIPLSSLFEVTDKSDDNTVPFPCWELVLSALNLT